MEFLTAGRKERASLTSGESFTRKVVNRYHHKAGCRTNWPLASRESTYNKPTTQQQQQQDDNDNNNNRHPQWSRPANHVGCSDAQNSTGGSRGRCASSSCKESIIWNSQRTWP